MRAVSVAAGIGGFELGLAAAGIETVAQIGFRLVEVDKVMQR